MKQDPLDPQKHLIYAWEDQFRCFGERTLTRAQALRFLRRVARKWRIEMPVVEFMPREKREWSYVQGRKLGVNYHQCNHAILAHEMAHWVIAKAYEMDVEDHGEEFMAVYLAMLEFAEVAPMIALEASAGALGIRWRLD